MGPALYGNAMYKENSIYTAPFAVSSRSPTEGPRRQHGHQDQHDPGIRAAKTAIPACARRVAPAPRIGRRRWLGRAHLAAPHRGHDLERARRSAALLRARLDSPDVFVG